MLLKADQPMVWMFGLVGGQVNILIILAHTTPSLINYAMPTKSLIVVKLF